MRRAPGVAAAYPHIARLYDIGSTVPTNSVTCESGFSVVNNHKEANQSRLGTETLHDITMVAMGQIKRGNDECYWDDEHQIDYLGIAHRFQQAGLCKRFKRTDGNVAQSSPVPMARAITVPATVLVQRQ